MENRRHSGRREIMSGFLTDILALTCIAGSAATSGAVTLAFLDGQDPVQGNCAVGEFSVAPNVVVSGRAGAHAIVMSTPRVHVHASHDCGAVVSENVRIRMKGIQRDLEEARVRFEVARVGAEEARMQGEMMKMQAEEIRHVMEEARERALEARGNMDEVRLQEIQLLLEKVEKGSGGQLD
jgi:hypothetical protein